MRTNLIKLLRGLEQESGFENEYSEYDEKIMCDYSIKEHIGIPNYRTIIRQYNEVYPMVTESGLVSLAAENGIKSELKRMEADGLIMIGTQEGRRFATAQGFGPDFNEGGGLKFTTEGIVLTTKGKSPWRYFIHKAMENPVTTTVSFLAIIISIIALFLGK